MNVVDAFAAAMRAAGIEPPDAIDADGKLHRFSTGGKPDDDAGWYVLHDDGVAAGAFGDWRSGVDQTWSAKRDSELTEAERRTLRDRIERANAAREAGTQHRHAEAAARARAMWDSATYVITHPYLAAKQVKAYGVRLLGANLLVPVRDVGGVLCSLQTITPDGEKRFLYGGRVSGCYHGIGRVELVARGRTAPVAVAKLLVCEGYATGATLHESTGHATAVAFNAGNLLPVALEMRQKYPSAELIVCADDDWKTPGNPGMTAARHAADVTRARLAYPRFRGVIRGDTDTDFNDLERLDRAGEKGKKHGHQSV